MHNKSMVVSLVAVFIIIIIQALYLKSLPGSLIRVYATEDIDDFNTPPSADMTAQYDGYIFDYRIPFRLSDHDCQRIKDMMKARQQPDLTLLIDIATWVRNQLSFGHAVGLAAANEADAGCAVGNRGLCDRYAQYFTAACHTVALPARIVELNGHVVPEAFLREPGRWIMVDPMLGYYLTREGIPLSVAEIIDVYRNNQQPEAVVFASARGDDSLYRAEDEENLKQIYLNGFTVVSNQQLRPRQAFYHIARRYSLPVAKLQYLDKNSVKLGRTESVLRVLLAVNAAVCVVLGIIILAGAFRGRPG